MRNARVAVPLCAATWIALAAGGCGGSSGTPSSAGPATSNAAPRGITPPGAKLAIGQTATVPFQKPGSSTNAPPYRIQVTIESITKASRSDFNGIQLDAAEKAGTPYYVRFKITNIGDGDLGANAEAAVSGLDDSGSERTSVTFIGRFPPCNDTDPPKPFTRGRTWSTCQVYLVPGGITGADYSGSVESYVESPVTWK
jgi:hypothetical protein